MELEEAIKDLKTMKEIDFNPTAKNKTIDTILNYISKLQEENRSLKQENDFLKQLYSGTEEFKRIERFANEK